MTRIISLAFSVLFAVFTAFGANNNVLVVGSQFDSVTGLSVLVAVPADMADTVAVPPPGRADKFLSAVVGGQVPPNTFALVHEGRAYAVKQTGELTNRIVAAYAQAIAGGADEATARIAMGQIVTETFGPQWKDARHRLAITCGQGYLEGGKIVFMPEKKTLQDFRRQFVVGPENDEVLEQALHGALNTPVAIRAHVAALRGLPTATLANNAR